MTIPADVRLRSMVQFPTKVQGSGSVTVTKENGIWTIGFPGFALLDGDKGDITVSAGTTVWSIDNNAVTYAKMQDVSATARLIGRITAGAGDPEELTGTQATTLLDTFTSGLKGLAPSSGGGTINFLRADGTWTPPVPNGDKGDVTVTSNGATWTIDNQAVTYAKMQNVSVTSRFIGRITAGAGSPEELTGTQATTLLDTFTNTLKGLAPASGGGTTNFLRADGTWAAPPSSPPGGSNLQLQYNSSGAFAGANVWRTGANQLDLSNGVTAQQLRVYNTTDTDGGAPTNAEWGSFDWTASANVLTIGSQKSGTGLARNVRFQVGGTTFLDYGVSHANQISFTGVTGGTAAATIRSTSNTGYSSIDSYDDAGIQQGSFGYANTGVGGILAGTQYIWTTGSINIMLNSGGSVLMSPGAGLVEQRSSGSSQVNRVYNTTDATTTNYERWTVNWGLTANVCTIGTQAGGTGTLRPIVVVGASIQFPQETRVTADFSVTSSTVLTNVTGLSVNVVAGRTYHFEAQLSFTDAAAGGVQAAIGGSATATNIIYDGWTVDSAANGIKGNTQATALGTAVASTTTTGTAGHITIYGTITVNAGGTLTVQFAQNTSNATSSVVKRGSKFIVRDIA